MNFKEMFLEINSSQEKEILAQIKKFFANDIKYKELKRKAVKNSDNVPDFIDYVYHQYEDQIDQISKKYKMKYDEIANLFLEA